MYLSRDAAAAFFEADVDGNEQLDFEEFMNAIPAELKKSMAIEQIRDLFESTDADGSGSISMDEFFLWTMSVVAHHTGSGIEAIFRSYDATGEGMLDPAEFAAACEDLGFGAMAPNLCVPATRPKRAPASPRFSTTSRILDNLTGRNLRDVPGSRLSLLQLSGAGS